MPLVSPPLIAARRWPRPKQLSRQTASLAFGVCHSRRSLVLARRAAVALISRSGLWFPLCPW